MIGCHRTSSPQGSFDSSRSPVMPEARRRHIHGRIEPMVEDKPRGFLARLFGRRA